MNKNGRDVAPKTNPARRFNTLRICGTAKLSQVSAESAVRREICSIADTYVDPIAEGRGPIPRNALVLTAKKSADQVNISFSSTYFADALTESPST